VDPLAATREFFEAFPGLGGTMEEDTPGMHASLTVDYGVVLSGQVELELDDGVKKTLGPGDCVIRNGTRHRWHNVGAETCRVVFSVVGARRSL
jgi:quercetin dioxygenase-like cupin family protein